MDIMQDITPNLIERVDEYYRAKCMANASLPRLAKKLDEGKATYDDAYKYAEAIGKARADAFAHVVSSDVLPSGRMYYNIANRLLTETLGADHEVVSAYATGVQELINQRDGISLAAQSADLDKDRIKGFIEGVCNAEVYDDVAWKLGEPVVTHARSVVDDTVKKNAEFQSRAGIKATVIRNATSKCCEWCSDLAGDYTYPNVPREVFQRHDNCKCTVDYEGRRLTAYSSGGSSRTFRDQGEQERIDKASAIINESPQKDYVSKYSAIQAAQTAGDTKQPLSIVGDFEDFKPLDLTEEDKKILLELNRLAKLNNYEYGYATYKGGNTEPQTDEKYGDIIIRYPHGSKEIKLFHSHTDESTLSIVDLSALINPDVEKTHLMSINGDVWTASVGQGIRPTKEEFTEARWICYDGLEQAVMEHPDYSNWTYEERYYMLVRENMLRIGRYFEWDIAGGRL